MEEEKLIRDIPTYKKTLEDIQNMQAFNSAFPILKPFLKLLKIDVNKISDTFQKFDELKKQAEELSSIPDEFNDIFSRRGWIIYDFMNIDICRSAIKEAKKGDIKSAEQILTGYYKPETVEWKLRIMNAVAAFRDRMNLARKAAADYRACRYHACIPVVLALMDGLVNELHINRRGFFSDSVDLTAWDSIAAHSKGLNALTAIMQKGRYKTHTEEIEIPYRNGIMHGMDLGYANKIVAAKCWGALFAVRDWAVRVENDQIEAPKEKPKQSFLESIKEYQAVQDYKKQVDSWRPRKLKKEYFCVETPIPEQFENKSPEKLVSEFLNYWQKKNYGFMTKCLSPVIGPMPKTAPKEIRETFSGRDLVAYNFLKITDEAAAITEVQTVLSISQNNKIEEKEYTFRLICQDKDGNPLLRDLPDSYWYIVNWSVY